MASVVYNIDSVFLSHDIFMNFFSELIYKKPPKVLGEAVYINTDTMEHMYVECVKSKTYKKIHGYKFIKFIPDDADLKVYNQHLANVDRLVVQLTDIYFTKYLDYCKTLLVKTPNEKLAENCKWTSLFTDLLESKFRIRIVDDYTIFVENGE